MALPEESASEEEVVQEEAVPYLRQEDTRKIFLSASTFSFEEIEGVSSRLVEAASCSNGAGLVFLTGSNRGSFRNYVRMHKEAEMHFVHAPAMYK